jgi:hypothetical protein
MPRRRKPPPTALEIEESKKRKAKYDRLRRQGNAAEESNIDEDMELVKEKDRDRQRLRRQRIAANTSIEDMELVKKRDRERQRIRRQKVKDKDNEKNGIIDESRINKKYKRLLENERKHGYDPELEMVREKNRIRSRKNYKKVKHYYKIFLKRIVKKTILLECRIGKRYMKSLLKNLMRPGSKIAHKMIWK